MLGWLGIDAESLAESEAARRVSVEEAARSIDRDSTLVSAL